MKLLTKSFLSPFRAKIVVLLIVICLPFNIIAALTEGNFTAYSVNPGGTSMSFSHTQNTGDDGHLILLIACPAKDVSSVTYNGVGMTEVREENTSYSVYWSVWELDDPAIGSNTVAITISAPGTWNIVSAACYSFTGCSGVGNTGFNNTKAVNQTTSVTISENSMIIAGILTGNTTSEYIEIPDGTSRTVDWDEGISGNYHIGGISPSLSSGATTIQGGTTDLNIILGVEVQEAAAAVSRRVIICD